MQTALSDIPVDSTREISGITEDSTVSRRLAALGFRAGAHVRVIGKAPFGDPIVVALEHGRVALRKNEAALILVGDSEHPESQ